MGYADPQIQHCRRPTAPTRPFFSGFASRNCVFHFQSEILKVFFLENQKFHVESEKKSAEKNQTISKDLLYDTIALIQEEISPITDIRGSKDYKRLLIHQLVIKSFVNLFPNRLSIEEFYEKH